MLELLKGLNTEMIAINIVLSDIPQGLIAERKRFGWGKELSPVVNIIYTVEYSKTNKDVVILSNGEYSCIILLKKNKCIVFKSDKIDIQLSNKRTLKFFDKQLEPYRHYFEIDIETLKYEKNSLRETQYIYDITKWGDNRSVFNTLRETLEHINRKKIDK